MRKTTIHAHQHISGGHTQTRLDDSHAATLSRQWDAAVDQLNQFLETLADRCNSSEPDLDALTDELSDQLHRVEESCRALEQALSDPQAVRGKQAEFRQRTDRYFSQSYLMQRARTWPRGYPGDYEIIEAAYNDRPVSPGIGALLDRYFLSTTLARAIQHRREKMRDMLAEEMKNRPDARVLNIGCGPCREVWELAPVIKQFRAHFTNIDFDTDALLFSAQRLREAGIADHADFRQYNAVRMVNAQKNVREFGHFDVIYTIGLLDYLSDEILVRLLKSLYATLKPEGALIAVFKDCDQYATEDYHWLVDWSAFLQRRAQSSRALFRQAGIPDAALTASRTCDNVMIFYRVLNMAKTATGVALQGPHDRRQETGLEEPRLERRGRQRQARPSWHRREPTR